MRASHTFFFTLVFTLLLTAACGDDGTPADTGVDTGMMVDSTVDTGSDSGPMGETLTVLVLNGAADDAPIEGVTVEAMSSAGMVMGTTGADGRAALEGVVIDGAAISVSASGMTAATIMNMTAAHLADFSIDGALFMRISPLAPSRELVTISGTVSNGMAEGEWWTVTLDAFLPGYFGMDAMYSVEAPSNEERVAAVLEFDLQNDMRGPRAGRSAVITTGRLATFPASAADATVDIDLAVDALPVLTATGTFPIPAAPHAMHDSGIGYFIVSTRDTNWFLGESGHLSADVDNTRFDYDANWIAPAEATSPVTNYILQEGPINVVTTVDGWPTDGDQDVTFLDVVDIVSPAFGEPLRAGETITANGIDPAHGRVLQVRDESDSDAPFVVWQVASTAGGELSLPPAPANASLGGTLLGGSVFVCEIENPGPDFFCRRTSGSRAFDVEP